jgi:hypothetical protein
MDPKPQISPNDTYLDDDDDELDAFSITAILEESDVAAGLDDEQASPDGAESARRSAAAAAPAEAQEREPTIDELLDGSYLKKMAPKQPEPDPDNADTGTHACIEVLLPPDQIFPTRDDDD